MVEVVWSVSDGRGSVEVGHREDLKRAFLLGYIDSFHDEQSR